MKRPLRSATTLLAVAVLAFSLYKIGGYLLQANASGRANAQLADMAVRPVPQSAAQPAPGESAPPPETAPIEVDFALLRQQSEDIAAWLYSEGTVINYPVARAQDNEYYLSHLPDGSYNSAGTLYIDRRCESDVSGLNTIIYGHSMKNKTMFGTLLDYKKQEYYDAHPVLWLLTPQQSWRVELLGGWVTTADAEIYTLPQTQEDAEAIAAYAAAHSTFAPAAAYAAGDRLVTLSTCSYEYDEARYVLVGRLVPVE